MFKAIRITILLFILFFVGVSTWLTQARSTDWGNSLWVKVYPINADGSDTSRDYIAGLDTDDFSDIEDPHERWRAYDIQNYEIRQMWGCFCAPPHEWTAIIENNQVVDVIVDPIQGTDPVEMHARAMEMAWTVEEGFDQPLFVADPGWR